ncbi:MAG: pro-sigmaK processing inhibitor BofA family protein [Clostridia bacterium]|nr:pro-sigmaK processing inhibitor BofA family protein [Clostridia bacterium]
MNLISLLCMICAVTLFYSLINAFAGVQSPVKKSIVSTFLGLASLILINIFSPITNVFIPISILSICAAAAGSVPGVILIALLNAFF